MRVHRFSAFLRSTELMAVALTRSDIRARSAMRWDIRNGEKVNQKRGLQSRRFAARLQVIEKSDQKAGLMRLALAPLFMGVRTRFTKNSTLGGTQRARATMGLEVTAKC